MGKSGYTCVRYIFCYLNIILWLSACGVLGVGSWLYYSHNGYTTLLPQYGLVAADSLLISLGAAIFIVTFFGCCGSWCQSRCLLVTLSACGVLGVGSWLYYSHNGYTTLLPQYGLVAADSLLISLGAAIFIVTFFGCCGSWCQSRCLLVTLSACGVLGVGSWLYYSHNGYTTLLPQYGLVAADSLLISLGAAIFIVTFFGCCGSWCQSRCLLVTLSACGVLGVGSWLYYSHNGYTTLLPQYGLVAADSLLISLGAAIFIVTFFGCCGSWCQSRCLLVTLSACGVLGVGSWLYYSHNGYTTLLPQYGLVAADSLLISLGAAIFIVTFFGCCGSWCQSRCLLVTLSACGVLGVGSWLYYSHNGYTTLLPQYGLVAADSLLISLGAAIFIVTFFGCCGSWCQSRCLLVTLSACGVLGVGSWLYYSHNGYTTLLPQYGLVAADSLLISLGAAIFIVTFFGCCGSWCQSRCLLVTYFTLVILLFMVEFMLATLAFVFRERLSHTMKDELLYGIEHHYLNPPDNGMEGIWDHVQTQFHCCGVSSYEDWFDIKAWPQKKYVPDSCCLPKFENMTGCGQPSSEADYNPEETWYMKGCSEQVQMWFVQRLHIVGIVGLVISFIQLFGLISSMLLFCTVRHKRTSHTYKSYDTTS